MLLLLVGFWKNFGTQTNRTTQQKNIHNNYHEDKKNKFPKTNLVFFGCYWLTCFIFVLLLLVVMILPHRILDCKLFFSYWLIKIQFFVVICLFVFYLVVVIAAFCRILIRHKMLHLLASKYFFLLLFFFCLMETVLL